MSRTRTDLELARRLLQEARPWWGRLALLLLLNLLAAPLTLLLPVPMKIAVDTVLGSEPLPAFLVPLVPPSVAGSSEALLLFTVALVMVIAVLTQARALASSALHVYLSEHLVLHFRTRLFGHAQRLSLAFHDATGSGDPLYRIQYDATSIEGVSVKGVIPLISATVTLVAMLYVTARIDGQLAAVALLVAPVILGVAHVYRRRLRSQWAAAKELESKVLGVVDEVLSAIRIVKAFGQEARESSRFVGVGEDTARARVRATIHQGLFGLILGVLVAGGTALVLYLGVRHVQEGLLSLGDLVLVMLYLAMLYQPVQDIGMKVAALQQALASADRAYDLLAVLPDVTDRPDAVALDRAQGRVTFEHVTFAYDPDHPVLRDVCFDVPAGSLVGVVGETGAGKSTLLGLLPRFRDPTSGRILLDGVDLRDVRRDDLRGQFAVVLQESILFSTTIRENIAYGRPGADDEAVEAAARAANVHDIILGLPQGYGTLVGDRGMMLSGGQRQLVSLARAFLRDAPILILDEPTSAVDVATEGRVLDALRRLVEGRTTFMISHRLYTLEDCDRVLFVGGGRVAVDAQDRIDALARGVTDRDGP